MMEVLAALEPVALVVVSAELPDRWTVVTALLVVAVAADI
jgi:hypothetical protein